MLVICVLQRVNSASVTVAAEVVARIGLGLVALVGVARGDSGEDARPWVRRSPVFECSETRTD